MRRLLVFLIVFFGFVIMLSAQDAPEPNSVTVRLFSTYPVQEITFIPLGSNDEIRFCSQCPQEKIGDSTTWKKIDGELHMLGDPHVYKQVQFQGAFRVRVEGSPQVETAAGQWVIRTTDTGIRTLLTTSTERYVMATLSGEASPDEPFESLKAMAIVARTFALLNAHRHAAAGFGLCDNTHCQALRFGSVRSEIKQAVLATTGETLWDRTHRA
jgi:stage II sporulation protein D (peptidoglycan lytic transglycosylase)